MAVGIEACFHEERLSDDGAATEAYHEEMWKSFTLILLFFLQALGGNRRDVLMWTK